MAYNSYTLMFMALNHHEDPIVKIYHLNNEKLFLLPCPVYLQMQNTGKAAISQLHCIKQKVTAFIAPFTLIQFNEKGILHLRG